MEATFDNGNSFNTKLHDTLVGLLNANKERKGEIDQLRGDHEDLKKNFEDFQVWMRGGGREGKGETLSLARGHWDIVACDIAKVKIPGQTNSKPFS